jgi:hypothetical protein
MRLKLRVGISLYLLLPFWGIVPQQGIYGRQNLIRSRSAAKTIRSGVWLVGASY